MAVLGKDKALKGVARIGASIAALYAFISALSGGDPTAVTTDVHATTTAVNTSVDLLYRVADQWPILVAAVLPLYSKFYDAIKKILGPLAI